MLLYFVVLLEEAIYIWQKVSQLFCNLIVLRQELMGSPKRAFSIQLYWLTYGKKKKYWLTVPLITCSMLLPNCDYSSFIMPNVGPTY